MAWKISMFSTWEKLWLCKVIWQKIVLNNNGFFAGRYVVIYEMFGRRVDAAEYSDEI